MCDVPEFQNFTSILKAHNGTAIPTDSTFANATVCIQISLDGKADSIHALPYGVMIETAQCYGHRSRFYACVSICRLHHKNNVHFGGYFLLHQKKTNFVIEILRRRLADCHLHQTLKIINENYQFACCFFIKLFGK